MKDRIYVTEAQWQELAKDIQACQTWLGVQALMAKSWELLQQQQEQVIAYVGSSNVTIWEMHT